mmetsp:Transcript_95334/g.153745  ORF Transcript_95334/g.153745 Transcript_95334/m.153745 type:complete len:462 (+) Transcript_95334:186-1571(+)
MPKKRSVEQGEEVSRAAMAAQQRAEAAAGSSMRAHPHGLYPGAGYGSQPVYSGYGYGPPAMPIMHAHAASFGLAPPAVQAGAPPAVHAGAAAYAMANPAAHQAAMLAAMHAAAMSVAGMPPALSDVGARRLQSVRGNLHAQGLNPLRIEQIMKSLAQKCANLLLPAVDEEDALEHLQMEAITQASCPAPEVAPVPSSAAAAEEALDEEQDKKLIDAAREQALITAKEEREKRVRERTNRWICCDVLSDEVTKEDELNGSTLLKVLKECEFFRSAASISVTALEAETHKAAHRDTETRAAEAAQSGGLGGKGGRGKGASTVVTCIVRYKSALAELLGLEKNLVQWYSRRSEALLEEVAARLAAAFNSASVHVEEEAAPSPAKAAKSRESIKRLPPSISETFLTDSTAAVLKEIDDINASLAKFNGGRLPAIVLDADRRLHPVDNDSRVELNANGEEVVILDD